MTTAEKLTMLKVMVGFSTSDTSEDVALSVYLTLSAQKVLSRAYPFGTTLTEVPAQYETLQCEIAAYLWNKRGAEGQTSHSENSISRSYESSDVPESLLSHITPMTGRVIPVEVS